MIEQIKRALEKITEGEWKMNDMDTAYSNEVFVNPTEHVYREIAGGMSIEDAHFVANAPGWLRSLVDELERIGKRFLYEVNINEKLANQNSKLSVQVEELQKALEKIAEQTEDDITRIYASNTLERSKAE